MTIAFWCVLIAALMPFVLAFIAKAGDRSFNNKRPRDWYQTVEGYRKRAWWAQQNSFEALPLFAAAVIIAHIAGANPATLDWLAIAFIAARVGYVTCYLGNWHLLRSLSWLVGLGCCIAMFIIAA